MPRLGRLIVLALAFAAPALALAHADPAAPAPTPANPAGAVARRIDAVRAHYHLPPVRVDARMARTAHGHAVAMARYGFLAHDGRGGSSWSGRVSQAAGTGDVGEVLASLRGVRRAHEAQTVVLAWLRSPEHRAVVLSRRYRRIGVGRAWVIRGGRRTALYTVDFAAH